MAEADCDFGASATISFGILTVNNDMGQKLLALQTYFVVVAVL